jgi:LuxR family transcriptional regulator, quorum-sensing system regulator CviR
MHCTTAEKGPQDGYRLCGTDAIRLLEIIGECQGCRSRRSFQNLFPKIQGIFPCDYVLAVVGRLDGNVAVAVDGINVSFPEDWIRAYCAPNSFERDAVVQKHFATYATQYWADGRIRLEEPNALSLCRDFGLRRGYVAGLGSYFSGREGSLFCFSSATVKRDKRGDIILHHLVPHLHLALLLTLRPTSPPLFDGTLSRREKEVLDWLKEGKSSWDISVLLGIRERTVNFHVYNIMRKLGTSNRAQTVAVALHCGLIDLN